MGGLQHDHVIYTPPNSRAANFPSYRGTSRVTKKCFCEAFFVVCPMSTLYVKSVVLFSNFNALAQLQCIQCQLKNRRLFKERNKGEGREREIENYELKPMKYISVVMYYVVCIIDTSPYS